MRENKPWIRTRPPCLVKCSASWLPSLLPRRPQAPYVVEFMKIVANRSSTSCPSSQHLPIRRQLRLGLKRLPKHVEYFEPVIHASLYLRTYHIFANSTIPRNGMIRFVLSIFQVLMHRPDRATAALVHSDSGSPPGTAGYIKFHPGPNTSRRQSPIHSKAW